MFTDTNDVRLRARQTCGRADCRTFLKNAGSFSTLPWKTCVVCRKTGHSSRPGRQRGHNWRTTFGGNVRCDCYQGHPLWYMLEVVFCEAQVRAKKLTPEQIRHLVSQGDLEALSALDQRYKTCGNVEIRRSSYGRKYCSGCRKRISSWKSKVHWTEVAAYYRTLQCHICKDDCDPHDKDDQGWVGFSHPSTDHLTPRSRGGTDDMSNLRLAHFRCNSVRQATPLYEMYGSTQDRKEP